MKKTIPNQPVRGSQSGIAIMALFDLLGQKWNMRIMWELRKEPLNFRTLQESSGGLSPSVLNNRIKSLTAAELLILGEQGYELTELGRSLMDKLDPLRAWAEQWESSLKTQ